MRLFVIAIQVFALLFFIINKVDAALVQGNNTVAILKRGLNDCLVNSVHIDKWRHALQSQYRVGFSSYNTPAEAYCDIWKTTYPMVRLCNYPPLTNFKCYHHDELGTWVIDASCPLGIGGDKNFKNCLAESRDQWMYETGCGTG